MLPNYWLCPYLGVQNEGFSAAEPLLNMQHIHTYKLHKHCTSDANVAVSRLQFISASHAKRKHLHLEIFKQLLSLITLMNVVLSEN